MQFTLTELWERQQNGLMTHQAYDELGRLERTLADHAERVWTGLGAAERVVAGRLLVQLLRPMPDVAAFTRRVALRAELDDAQWDMAGRLATAGSSCSVSRSMPDRLRCPRSARSSSTRGWSATGNGSGSWPSGSGSSGYGRRACGSGSSSGTCMGWHAPGCSRTPTWWTRGDGSGATARI